MKFNEKLTRLPVGVAVFAFLALAGLVGLLAVQSVMAQGTDGTPVIEEAPATFTHEENDGDEVYTFRARDPEGKRVFWTLGGTDAADFTIDDGTLKFMSAPDFEMPTDREQTTPADGANNNIYNVTVRFSDGGAPAGTHSMTVTVTNVEEMGMVMLSPMQPQVGSELTATVTDPDGNVQAEYQWYKSDTMDDADPDIIDGADEMTYTPTADDEGSYLTVKARYVDGHGSAIDNEMATATMPVRPDTTANEAPEIPDQDISNATDDQPADTTPTRFVLENMPPGTPVGPPVTAVDDNLDGLTYAFGGEAANLTAAESFDIDPATGQITTNRVLNREVTASYAVVVTATDADGEVVETAAITISVTDEDEAPMFTGTPIRELNVAENSADLDSDGDATNNPETITYAATDPDPRPLGTGTSTITWSLKEGSDPGFSISDAGVLTATAQDYEDPQDANKDNVYELTVVAADSQYPDAKKGELLVTVKVTDVDEGQSAGSITIFNRQPEVGIDLFLDGPLTDPDGGVSNVTWQWYSNDAACPAADTDGATLDPDRGGTGWTKIDRATSSSYTPTIDDHTGADESQTATCLMVRAKYKDGGPPGVDNIGTPDHDESYQYAYALSANQVQAEDDNNLKPMFDDGDDSTQGIQTRARIAENTTTDPLVIVSEIAPAATAAATTSGAIPITVGLAEDSNAGAVDNLTYTLGGPDADDFTINKANGQVTMDSPPDYEAKDSYTFIVIATDPTNAKSDQDPRRTNGITVIVEVTDVDEPAMFTDEPTHVVYEENGMGPVAAYPASDPDDDSFTWELAGDDAEDFEISQLDGSLKFEDSPDFEDPQDTGTNNEYVVTVNLMQDPDGDGTATAVDTATVMVKVVDMAEAPEFTSDTVTLNIDENRYPDMMLNRVVTGSPQAYDDDVNRVVSLEYTISPMYGAFGIVPATGELRTAQVLDYESLADPSYEVTVTATDPTGMSDSIVVTIDVNDVDEPPVAGGPNQAPEFPAGPITREVAEGTGAGMNVGAPVIATDPENNNVTYSLGGADMAHFTIDTMTGQLMTMGALDFEAQSSYTVEITAMDDDQMEPMSSMATVIIMVTNVDEDGTVTVTPATAGVGGTFTASLMDEDGPTGISWDWWYDDMMDGDFMDQVPGALSATYTAEAAYAGMYLKARAVYTDGEFGAEEVGSNVVMVVADPHQALITKYDTSGNNAIERAEVLAAIDRLLANDPGVTRTEVLGLIDLLLQRS